MKRIVPLFSSHSCPSVLFVFLLPLVLLSAASCEFWEDWMDSDKPLPSGPVSHGQPNRTSYSREEASSLVCNKLIIRFSSLPEKPAVSCRLSDDMARGVASLLKGAHAITADSTSGQKNVYAIETVPSRKDIWHVKVTCVSTGQVFLDEDIPLRSEPDRK